MNKWIGILLITLSSQAHSYQEKVGSTAIFAELLSWQLHEGSSENWAQAITPSGTQRNANLLKVPFDWNTGARVGIGRNTSYENLDVVFYYTWFQSTAFSQASVTSGGLYSPYLGNFYANNTNGANFGPNYRNASLQWKFLFNNLDLELGHKFKINPFLSLRPFVGLKGASIKQNINTIWKNPNPDTFFGILIPQNFTTATENLQNDFFGIGPSLGLNTVWYMFKNPQHAFNFFGDFSGALMWGHWKFKDQYKNNNNTTITVNVSNINGACSMARAVMGFEWNSYFSKANVKVRLAYEAQIWFDQVQYYNFNMGRLNNLMSLQGGVLGISLIF